MRMKTFKCICIHRFYIFLLIIINPFLSLVLLSAFLSEHSYAEVWNDSFDDENLKGWERIWLRNRGDTEWKAIAGLLFVNIDSHERFPPVCDKNSAEFLHWKIVQFNFEQLTIVGEEITYPQEGKDGMGELCLFIGKRQDDPDLAAQGYIVSPEEVSKVTFSENVKYSRGKTKAWYGDIFQDTTRNLTTVFDTGHFQVYTNNDLITEFTDENLKNIDIVGLLITCHVGGQWFGSRISNISISDKATIKRNLAVQLRDTQLTTTWGALKQF